MVNYLKIKINQIRTAKLRGMDVSEEESFYKNMTQKQFQKYTKQKINPKTFKNILNATYYQLNPQPDSKLKVLKIFYINKTDIKTISKNIIKGVNEDILKENKSHPTRDYSAIIIGEVPLSPSAKEEFYPDLNIMYFEENDLGYFALDSEFSSKYEELDIQEKTEVMEDYKVRFENSTAWILHDEQIVMVHGWKIGTVLRVIRDEPGMSIIDTTFNYRIVIKNPSK